MSNQKTRKNSLGSIEEYLKRKRESKEKEGEEESEADIFKRSKQKQSSPEGKVATNITDKKNEEGNMDIILSKLEAMEKDMKVIRSEVENTRKELTVNNEAIKKFGEELRKIKEDQIKKEVQWEKEKTELRKEVNNLKDKLEKQEKDRKRNNIVIKGLELGNTGRPEAEIEKFMQEKLQVKVNVRKTSTFGRRGERQVVVAEIASFEEKIVIMKNKAKLGKTKIFIDNDLTKEEQLIQANIRSVAKKERENGKRTQVGYRKLKINDTQFEWTEEDGGRLKLKNEEDPTPKN